MKKAIAIFLAIIWLAAAYPVLADPLATKRSTPDELTWDTSPNGTARARIVGNDEAPGLYMSRFRFAAGDKVMPHFHPDDRVGTVMTGTLYVGYGEHFDESVMKRLPAGSIWTEPANQPHFVWAKDGEVVIQMVGIGPSGMKRIEAK